MSPTRILAVFGASGGTGLQLVLAAHERGWGVQAMGRAATPPPELAGLVTWQQGEFSDTDAIATTLAGCTAACCLVGPRFPRLEVFCADATRAIIAGMKAAGLQRLVCLTGAMSGDYPANRTLPFRLTLVLMQRRLGGMLADRERQEEIVRTSDLDWTVLKPPRLTDGPRTTDVRMGVNLRVGMLSSISRADVAVAMLDELEQPQFVRQVVFLK